MPSQPPHKNTRSVALSHFKCVFDQDPEMTRQQNEEREYKIYKRKIHTKPTDFLEEMHQKIEDAKLVKNRILSEASKGAAAIIDMQEVV